MSSYLSKKIKCNCCKNEYTGKLLKGFFNNTSMDLDTNPHNPAVFDRVVMCPKCGYSTANIKNEVSFEVYEHVYSQSYQNFFRDNNIDENYKKLYLAAELDEIREDYRNAGYEYLMAYWYLKEKQTDAAEVLQKAIKNYEKYLEDTVDIQSAIILIDCMRQYGNFDEAAETAESLLSYVEETQWHKFVRYELELISQKDAEAHSVDEVL